MVEDEYGETTHVSERGEEPRFGEVGKVDHAEKVETGTMAPKRVKHRLRDLKKDYYLFTVAPIYFVTGFANNIVELFAQDLRLSISSIAFVSDTPIFSSGGDWNNVIEGVPWDAVRSTVDSDNNLLETFILGMVLPRRKHKELNLPRQYWRVNKEEVRVREAGAMASTPVDVYVPTGDLCRISTRICLNGVIDFLRMPPEEWVTKQALAYYETGGV